MYSQKVIAASIMRYEKEAKQRLAYLDPAKCADWVEHLKARWDSEKDDWQSPLTKEEAAFIRNERVMSALDYEYWATRYCTIQADGGGISKHDHPWESQILLRKLLATIEDEMMEMAVRGDTIEGIKISWHKARQLGATAEGRSLMMHRMVTQKYRRCMSASVDDDKIMEMYDRDKLIYDNLPHWLKPSLKYDTKGESITFDGLESRVLYQIGTQKSGMGVGRQFELGHLTECSSWLNPRYDIEMSFFPTIPQSRQVLTLLESTALMIGDWWNDFTEGVRKGHYRGWRYFFIPYYVEESKYRATPSVDWEPNDVSLLHAQKVYDTSPEFMGGNHTMLSKEKLYWWETTRSQYKKAGSLNLFLSQFCATPEESFQHTTKAAFDAELIQKLRDSARPGLSFAIEGVSESANR